MGSTHARWLVASVLLATAGAWAQSANEPAADPLRGPKVGGGADAAAPSLVERGFDGSMALLEERPETAALKRLTLSADEQKAVDDVLAQRAAAVQKVLTENMALFNEVQGARQSNDREATRRLMPQFREAAAELLTPPLRERLGAALTPANAGELNRLVDEYMKQLPARDPRQRQKPAEAGAGMGEQPAMPERARPERTPQRMELNLTIREMARSLQAMVTERRERTDAMLKAVGATPEQEARIQAILREKPGSGPPGPEARAERTRKIMGELTPEQRRAWMKAAREN